MQLKQLRFFLEVVECGSISKASERLFLSQPNLSRSIHLLEEELGEPLLLRSAQGVEPTEFGRQVYYYAKSIHEQVDMLTRLRQIREKKALIHSLKMSVSNFFLQDNLILGFQEKGGGDNVEIHFHETTAERAVKDVADGDSDFALMVINDRQMPVFLKMMDSQNLKPRIWDRSQLYVHVYKDHALADRSSLRVGDLQDYTYIHLPHDFFANLNLLMHEEHIVQWISQKNITISNYHAMLQILRYSGAYMIGNKWQMEELAHSSIRSIPLEGAKVTQNFVFLCRDGGNRSILPEAAMTFLELLQETYQFPDYRVV
ncbi:MAG: LysR family transcriptional regulator [Eubacteriales bacterium]|nr:LysR family transcriptional regulator [Eubacteriales bacterium]